VNSVSFPSGSVGWHTRAGAHERGWVKSSPTTEQQRLARGERPPRDGIGSPKHILFGRWTYPLDHKAA